MEPRLTTESIDFEFLDEPTLEFSSSDAIAELSAVTTAPAPSATDRAELLQFSIQQDVVAGAEITLVLRLRGDRDMSVQCLLPPQITYQPDSTTLNGKPAADQAGSSPLQQGLPLPSDGDSEVTLRGRLAATLAESTFLQLVANLLQNQRVVSTLACFAPSRGQADFTSAHACRLSAVPSGQVKPGDVITYTFTINNRGSASASSICLRANSPRNVVYVPNSTCWEGLPLADTDGTSPLFAGGGLYVGTVTAGKALAASFQVRVVRPLDNGSELTCEGRVMRGQDTLVNFAPLGHAVASAPSFERSSLAIMDGDSHASQVQPGETLRFRVRVLNSGDSSAYETHLSLSLPPHVELVPGTVSIDDVKCAEEGLFSPAGLPLGTVEAAPLDREPLPRDIRFEGRFSTKSRNSARLELNGTVWARNCPPRALTSQVAIQASPRFEDDDCSLQVTPSGLVRPGDSLTYRVRLHNSGNAPATYAVLRASLPAEALFVPGSITCRNQAVSDEDGTGVLFGLKGLSLGEVDRGESVEVSFRARVVSPLQCGTVIQVRSSLTCAELPPLVLAPLKVEVTSSPSFTSAENYIELVKGAAVPGSNLQYILHFRNNGDADAHNLTLRSVVPEHALLVPKSTTLFMDGRDRRVEDVSGVPALFSTDGLQLGTLKAGQIGRVAYSLRLKRPLADGTQMPHAVSIACDGARFLELMAPIVTVSSAPNFSGDGNELTVAPVTDVAPGELLNYSLRYRNNGGSDAPGIVLRVILPPQSTLLADSITVDGLNSAPPEDLFEDIGLPLLDVGVDEGGEIRFQARIHSPLDPETVLECQASIDGPTDQLANYTVGSKVKSNPDYGQTSANYLSATPLSEVTANHVIRYSIRYHNTGNARAYRVHAFLEMAEQLQYQPGSTTLNGKPVVDVEGISPLFGQYGLFIGPQEADSPGEITLQARVTSPIESGTILQARATLEVGKRRGVVAAEEPPPRFVLAPVVHKVISFADFSSSSLEVSPSGPVAPGQTLQYTLRYRNSGTGTASDVLLLAQIPQNTTQCPGSFHLNGQPISAKQIADLLGTGLQLGKVSAAESGTLTYQVTLNRPLDNGLVIRNRTRITSPSANAAAEAAATNEVTSRVDFSAEGGSYVRASVDRAAPGDAVLYTIHLVNHGEMNANGVKVSIQPLGHELSYVPDLCTLSGVPLPEPLRGGLLEEGIDVGDIAVGGTAELTFTLRVHSQAADGASLPVNVGIVCKGCEPIVVEAHPLRISAPYDFVDSAYNKLDVYPLAEVSAGQVLTYTLAYGNRGTGPAPDVVLRAVLPSQCSYVPATTFLNGEQVTDERDLTPLFSAEGLQVGTVAPGAYGDVVWQVRVNQSLPNGMVVNCSAKVAAAGKHAFTTNSTQNTVRSLVNFSEPDGCLLEVSPEAFVEPRDTLTYTFHYHNKGNSAASDVVLIATLPPYTNYLARSTRLNGLPLQDTDDNSPLFLPQGLMLPRIDAGEAGRVTVRLLVDGSVPSGSEIPFQIELRCTQAPPIRSNQVSNGVVSFPRFIPGDGTFLKSYPSKVAPPGQVITFVLYYQNRGSTEASELNISARLPKHSSYVVCSTRVDGVAKDDVEGTSPVLSPSGLHIAHVAPGASGTVSIQLKIDDDASDESVVELQVRLTTEPFTTPTHFEGKVLVKCRREASRRSESESEEGAASDLRRRRADHYAGDETAHTAMAVTEEQQTSVTVLPPPPDLQLSIPDGMTAEQMDKSKLSQAYCDRGSAYARRGYFENAVGDYSEAIRLNPANPFCYYNLGMAHLKLGDFEKAVEDYSSGIKIRPSDANAYNNLGNAYNKLGRRQEAIDAYTDAIRLNPRQGQIYLNRGLVYSLMGKTDLATHDFEEVSRLSPQLTSKIPPGLWNFNTNAEESEA